MAKINSEQLWRDQFHKDLYFGGTLLAEVSIQEETSTYLPALSVSGPPVSAALAVF